MPIHLDGGNRGCEAITKGTAIILGLDKSNFFALCRDVKLDNYLKIGKQATLISIPPITLFYRIRRKILSFFVKKRDFISNYTYSYLYDSFLSKMKSADVMLSTGGDMLCYENNEVIYTNNWSHKRGIKTILWGCSIGKVNLTPEKIDTLRNFAIIYARESLTSNLLKGLGLENVYTFPDPAFILEPEICELPDVFRKDVVGINISNYVVAGNSFNSGFGNEIKDLINYILDTTDYNIVLIPHVFWEDQDDRKISRILQEEFKDNSRIQILLSERLNYCELRYVIGHCRFFIGARTHAVISAYSMCVPTIALGYSIKSVGIATDLGLANELVVNSKEFAKGELVSSFKYMENNEFYICEHLKSTLPDYIKQLDNVKCMFEK